MLIDISLIFDFLKKLKDLTLYPHIFLSLGLDEEEIIIKIRYTTKTGNGDYGVFNIVPIIGNCIDTEELRKTLFYIEKSIERTISDETKRSI